MTELLPCGCSKFVGVMRRSSEGNFREVIVPRISHADACLKSKSLLEEPKTRTRLGDRCPRCGRCITERQHGEKLEHSCRFAQNAPTYFDVHSGSILYPPGDSKERKGLRRVWRRLHQGAGLWESS